MLALYFTSNRSSGNLLPELAQHLCSLFVFLCDLCGKTSGFLRVSASVVDLDEQCPLPIQDLSAPASVNLLT